MVVRRQKRQSRSGKILVMTAIMTPVFFSAALISTDTAVLVNAEAQMKTAADAAALAGATVLADETRLRGTTDLTSLMATSRAQAISVATQNTILGATPVVSDNPTNSTTGDVVIGYLSSSDSTSALPATTGSQTLFNSVTVNLSRDSSHGGNLPTFFGGPVGVGSVSLKVSSTASAYNYAIKGFQNVNNQSVSLLPIVLDQTTYNAMINRTTTDQYAYSTSTHTTCCGSTSTHSGCSGSSTGSVTAGADGVPESQLYPVSSGNPGNWGTIKVGVTNNSTSTLVSQIESGITAAQLATFSNSKIQLDSTLSPPSITFSGNPGLSAGIKSALTGRIGQTNYIGIYDQSSGNGNNTTYRVVAFAVVRVMAVNFQGNPKYVIVQPALVKDGSAVAGSLQSSWTNGGLVKVQLVR